MPNINKFQYSKENFKEIDKHDKYDNWPVVYMIEDGREMYIGQTIHISNRAREHYKDINRKKLNNLYVINDDEFNVSATLDIESLLIQYISSEGKYILQNGNSGLTNHDYYDRQRYQAKFDLLWDNLKSINIVNNDIKELRNSELFKYSPYKALTDDQLEIANTCTDIINNNPDSRIIINGGPGTGKTILATYLIKFLRENEKTKDLKIGLVVPMSSLRTTLKGVFKKVMNLSSKDVLGPSSLAKQSYDVLIVDEAHRLRIRKNIVNYKSFDDTNKLLGLDKTGNELDWVLKQSKHTILFYDKNQTVRPSDVPVDYFDNLFNESHICYLKSQIRVGKDGEGEKYLDFISNLLDNYNVTCPILRNYEFKIFDNLYEMVNKIKEKNIEHDLCRMVSGYAWEWQSKNNPDLFDIELDGVKLKWNSTNDNWVNSKNSINEVGCIHTVQGYDLNYTGVILGPEIIYNKEKKEIDIVAENYRDKNGKRGIENKDELKRYIINIYKTLLSRGILGTYIYVVDKDLKDYIKSVFNK